MDKRCFLGIKKPRKHRVYEVSFWCGKRDLNRTNVLLQLFAKPANALFYGVLERTKQNGLMQFLVSFWGNKAQISPKVMGVFR